MPPLSKKGDDEIVKRNEFEDLLMQLIKSDSKALNATVVVVGNRGIGKTTAVRSAFQNMKGVLLIECAGLFIGKKSVALEALRRLHVKAPVSDPVIFLESILERVVQKGKPNPIIVVDIDTRWKSEEVEEILLWAKKFGADNSLIKVVVVVSPVLSSYSASIGFTELRCVMLHLNEASDEEAEEFFRRSFSKFKFKNGKQFTSEDTERLLITAMAYGGRSFVYMRMLVDNCRRLSSKSGSLEEIETLIKSRMETEIIANEVLITSFIRKLRVSNKNIVKAFNTISNGGAVSVGELCDALGVEDKVLMEACHSIRPHPVYISLSKIVTASSPIMVKAMKNVLTNLKISD